MGFYDRIVLPRLLNLAMAQPTLQPHRQRVVGAATGRVLEIGVGPGHNLALYGPEVGSVVGLDPSPELLKIAQDRVASAPRPVTLVEGSAEDLRFETGSFDTLVTTWTLCSIPAAGTALAEARRVLKPGGALLFVEHGRSPDPGICRWQDRITPLWRHATGGCHLNRDIAALISGAGFAIAELDTFYMPGPKIATYLYLGRAAPQ